MGLDMYLYTQRVLPSDFALPDDLAAELLHEGEVYVSGHSFGEPERRALYGRAAEAVGLTACEESPSAFFASDSEGLVLRSCVGYWRKANAIHAWFVRECQDGKDECQWTPVTREALTTLRATCQQVLDRSRLIEGVVRNGRVLTEGKWRDIYEAGRKLDDPALAQELLPTQSGFFFGSTDYDEGYYQDLKDTIRIVERALSAPQDTQFFYQSSW